MMKRSFFGLSLANKQKFTFSAEEELICFTFTTVSLIGEGEAKLYGQTGKQKSLIASLNKKYPQQRCKFVLDGDYFSHIFCLGSENAQIDVIGYKLEKKQENKQEKKQEKKQNNLPFNDEFKALQPVPERELESEEIELLPKKEKKAYKKKLKVLQNGQNVTC